MNCSYQTTNVPRKLNWLRTRAQEYRSRRLSYTDCRRLFSKCTSSLWENFSCRITSWRHLSGGGTLNNGKQSDVPHNFFLPACKLQNRSTTEYPSKVKAASWLNKTYVMLILVKTCIIRTWYLAEDGTCGAGPRRWDRTCSSRGAWRCKPGKLQHTRTQLAFCLTNI